MHEITNCFHVELDPPPSIFDVFKGTTNLYYSPVFGGYSLPLKNAKVRRIQLKPSPLTYEEGKTITIYLLYYGDLLKIGTSSIIRVVNRMYVQAPFAGVIASIIRLDKSIKEPVMSTSEKCMIEKRSLEILEPILLSKGYTVLERHPCKPNPYDLLVKDENRKTLYISWLKHTYHQ